LSLLGVVLQSRRQLKTRFAVEFRFLREFLVPHVVVLAFLHQRQVADPFVEAVRGLLIKVLPVLVWVLGQDVF
jgi:hypothetical protein